MKNLTYTKYRWFILLVLFIVGTAQGITLISPSPLVGEISKTLGVSLGQVTAITMGSFTFCVAISAILGGSLIDKFGSVRIWVVCSCMMGIGLILTPTLGGTINGLMALRIIEGLGAGPIMASSSAVAAIWFPTNERGIVTAVQGMTLGLGIALGFIIVPGAFQSTGSWQVAMASLSILCGIGLILSLIAIFGPKSSAGLEDNDNQADSGIGHDMKIALSSPGTWAATACIFLLSWTNQAFNDMTPGYIAVDAPTGLGLGPVTAGQLMVGAQFANIIGAVLGGIIMEKIFKGKIKPVMIIGFVLSGILTFTLKLSGVYSSQSTLVIVLTFAGFFYAFINPQVMAFISKKYPERITGKIGGMALGIGIFGGTAGVSVGSYFLHTTNLYMMSINVILVISIIGVIAALLVNPPKGFSNKTVNNKGLDKSLNS